MSGTILPSDAAQFKQRSAPLTLIACVATIIIALGIAVEPLQSSWTQVGKWGYLPAERIWDGALWALVSSAFVHGTLWHLLFNVYWLWHLGGVVERALGSLRFLIFVIAVAFVSSAFQLAASDNTGIGASGVVYGLFGLMWRSRQEMPRFAEELGRDTPSLFFIWLVACLVATHAGFVDIGNAAHFSGLLFGVLVAEWQLRGAHRRQAGSATRVLCALSVLVALVNPWSGRWLEHVAMRMHRNQQYLRASLAYERSLSFGADSAWAFHNLALTYFALGDTAHYVQALEALRERAPAQADSLRLRLER